MKTLADAFHRTLQDVYFAEHSLITALPKVIKAVSQPALKRALQTDLAETKQHVITLERVFASVGQKATGEKCDAIEGLIKECDGVVAEAAGTAARHAAILGCCQAIEHYEIARYGTLREWAKTLGNSEAHELLGQILDQEKAANHTLTHLAVTAVNAA